MKYVILEYDHKYEDRWPIFYFDTEEKASFMIKKLEEENDRCLNEKKKIRSLIETLNKSNFDIQKLKDTLINRYTKDDYDGTDDKSYSVFNVKEYEFQEQDSKEFAIYELQR